MKYAAILFALIIAVVSAAGYLSANNVASGLNSAFGGDYLNNPFRIFAIAGSMPFAWIACTWMSIFGGDYKNCVYTHMYYAIQ